MKSTLLLLGKTTDSYILEGINKYVSRIKKYINFEIEEIPNIKNTKNLPNNVQKQKEGELILKRIQTNDYVILLDAKGKSMCSEKFAKWLNTVHVSGYKRIVFVVGGAYGFSNDVYKKSDFKISLSPMTFSHQIIRLIFVEQYYRAYTILKNEPYHH